MRKIHRRLSAFCLAVLLLVPTSAMRGADGTQAQVKPNIIFILADDYGIPGVGCYGGKFKTPNLDALAEGGVRFERCFSAPLCAPSRALCMFGRYAFRTGVLDNNCGDAATPGRERMEHLHRGLRGRRAVHSRGPCSPIHRRRHHRPFTKKNIIMAQIIRIIS